MGMQGGEGDTCDMQSCRDYGDFKARPRFYAQASRYQLVFVFDM